jgi:hypothetical protein
MARMDRVGVALLLLGISGCAGREVGSGPVHAASRPLPESRDVAERSAAATELEETVDDEVKQREARLKLAQARAAGCGVGLR